MCPAVTARLAKLAQTGVRRRIAIQQVTEAPETLPAGREIALVSQLSPWTLKRLWSLKMRSTSW